MSDKRHKIDFLHQISKQDENGNPIVDRDSYGEPVDDWGVFQSGVWASKEPILGNQYFASLTTDTRVDVKFECRFINGVKNEMRIKHGEEIYEILSAINVKSLNRDLLCYCRLVK